MLLLVYMVNYMDRFDSYSTRTLKLLRNQYQPGTPEYLKLTELILIARYGNKNGTSAVRELKSTLADWNQECTYVQLDLFPGQGVEL